MLNNKMLFVIAFRNIFRNSRRSIITIGAISVCIMTMILFGEYTSNIVLSFKTGTIIRVGHISIFKKGFQDYGSGSPGKYGIHDYQKVIDGIKNIPQIRNKIFVITPTINVTGLASNSLNGNSSNFYGIGWIPSEHDKMLLWDEFHVMNDWWKERIKNASGLSDDQLSEGVAGSGLAKILGVCQLLKTIDCNQSTKPLQNNIPKDIAKLISAQNQQDTFMPKIELLSVTADGSPNAASLILKHSLSMGIKELSDVYVGMHFKLAQQLLYGDSNQATSIVVQLKKSADIDLVKNALNQYFQKNNLQLEVYDFSEITPLYSQVIGMFGSIFTFIAAIMAVISLFTVINTMSMCVMERTNEIGTLMALGMQKKSILGQFMIEGALIGAIGSTVGAIIGQVMAVIINMIGMEWTPPGNDSPMPLQLLINQSFWMMIILWVTFVAICIIASYFPARRASNMEIVDALRHV